VGTLDTRLTRVSVHREIVLFEAERVRPILALRRPVGDTLDSTALVALQHLLPSVADLFRRFVDAGFKANSIFLVGKPYSTIQRTTLDLAQHGVSVFAEPISTSFKVGAYSAYFREQIKVFWRRVREQLPSRIRRIIVLDEGGWLRREMPEDLVDEYEIVTVEHTTYGLFGRPDGSMDYPVVLMAASAAKTRFESRVIADAIVERLRESVPDLESRRVGLVGLGNLGRAVAHQLKRMGIGSINGYDIVADVARELEFVERLHGVSELFSRCDVVLGCTGRDVVEPGTSMRRLPGVRWLASGSSGDVEFLRVARQLAKRSTLRQDPFAHARGTVNESDVVLLNGGFPLNFDRQREREHPVRIQLTRELTYASVLQAALCVDLPGAPAELMLDAAVQQMLVERWLDDGHAKGLFPKWEAHDLDWWQKHSRGIPALRSLSEYLVVQG
jgi:D-isomer specific 2-hydroxyacid dehydrogenase, NAD binding domain